MTDVFLSYSREDQPTARRFAEALKQEGFNVWWDQALTIGEAYDKITEQALDEAKAVVVLWSKHSVDSRWVRAEATQAQARGNLAPVMIEACKRPIMFELTHTAELAGWNGNRNDAQWRSFIDGLRRFTHTPAPTQVPVAPARPAPHALMYWAAAAAALVAVGAGLFWNFQGREAKAPDAVARSSAATAPATTASIAVLPFRDMR